MKLYKIEKNDIHFSKNKYVNGYKGDNIIVYLNKKDRSIRINNNDFFLECTYTDILKWTSNKKQVNTLMPLKNEYDRVHSISSENQKEIFQKVKEEILKIENLKELDDIE